MGLHAYVDSDDYRANFYKDSVEDHEFWRASYSSFHYMRTAIAKAAGWPLEPCSIRAGDLSPAIDAKKYNLENFRGEWAQRPDEILTVLIVHCDNEGRILHKYGTELADRLEGLKEAVYAQLGADWDKTMYDDMIRALRTSATRERDIVFH